MPKIAVVGATGYTGFELLRLLGSHGGVEVIALTSETYAGKRVDEVFPALSSVHGGTLVRFELAVCEGADVVFCCLPHRVAMNTVPSLLDAGHRVVDFSADYRLRDFGVYEAWYKTEHTSPERIADAVYGVPELYREEVRKGAPRGEPGLLSNRGDSGAGPAFEGEAHQARLHHRGCEIGAFRERAEKRT